MKDNSPNALAWLHRKYCYGLPVEVMVRQVLEPNATCRTMWLQCPNAYWLNDITMQLVTCNRYLPVRKWFAKQYPVPTANEYRAKCAKLGCYNKS